MYLLNFLMVSHPNTPVLPQNTKISDFKNSGNQNTQVFHIGNFFPLKLFILWYMTLLFWISIFQTYFLGTEIFRILMSRDISDF